ncbi:anti-sigma factor [Nocardioides sp. Leaf285]|uniref:anti-sigma factor n=1 Tax=Nocardioides sp. Leaf285 TaxID=1736322 RepID=UPI0007037630|nr:anti-sigma factor [Nocardioides sp. Leaf285]KQP63565.1 hypothetical protein ASF47_16080 [Nocardioides sp. Leaf285]
MSDSHALSGAYALDALDDLERAEFERHLATCPACRDEVDGLAEAASMMTEMSLTAPPPELRDRVLSGIATVRPMPPVVGEVRAEVTSLADRRDRRRFRGLLAAAAAAVVVAGTGGIVWTAAQDDTSTYTAAEAVQNADDAQRFRVQLAEGVDPDAEATVIRSEDLNRAIVTTVDMPPAPEGYVYELWLLRDGQYVAAGPMATDSDETVFSGQAADATGAAISIEEAGTQPVEPSDAVVGTVEFQA